MNSETSLTTSKDAPCKSAEELWAEGWLAERTKPSRQQNLTPSQRKVWAHLLRSGRSPETTWAVSPSTDTPGSQRALNSPTD